jgi:hypothetical protein
MSNRERLATLVSFQGVVSRHHNAKNKFRQIFPQISRHFRYLPARSAVMLLHPERCPNQFDALFKSILKFQTGNKKKGKNYESTKNYDIFNHRRDD